MRAHIIRSILTRLSVIVLLFSMSFAFASIRHLGWIACQKTIERALDLASGEAPSDLATRWKVSRAAVTGEKRILKRPMRHSSESSLIR